MELEVLGIRKSYGRKQVLRRIDLKADSGKCTGIVGANGCGKSTLLRILAGAEGADAGSILVDGKAIGAPLSMMHKYVGYVPQESVLMPELTVADNLKLWAGFGDYRKNRKRLEELCSQFRIHDFYKESVKNLSGGMCKRVNIVCGLVHGPSVLLMDEPSADLDLVFKEELKDCIRGFTQKGGSVLISSHDEGEIALCQSLWAIRDGVSSKVPGGISLEKMIAECIM